MMHRYIRYGVLTMCAYLDHLIKSLQLPYDIIWLQVNSYSVAR